MFGAVIFERRACRVALQASGFGAIRPSLEIFPILAGSLFRCTNGGCDVWAASNQWASRRSFVLQMGSINRRPCGTVSCLVGSVTSALGTRQLGAALSKLSDFILTSPLRAARQLRLR